MKCVHNGGENKLCKLKFKFYIIYSSPEGHAEDHEDGVNTLVHSSDAPEFESAVYVLSSASVKASNCKEDSAES